MVQPVGFIRGERETQISLVSTRVHQKSLPHTHYSINPYLITCRGTKLDMFIDGALEMRDKIIVTIRANLHLNRSGVVKYELGGILLCQGNLSIEERSHIWYSTCMSIIDSRSIVWRNRTDMVDFLTNAIEESCVCVCEREKKKQTTQG